MTANPIAAAALKKVSATQLGIDYGLTATLPSGTDTLGFKIAGDTGNRGAFGTIFGAAGVYLGDGAGAGELLYRPSTGLWTFSNATTAMQVPTLNSAPITKTASFDFAVADMGRTVLANSSSALTGTIRLNATVALPVGATITVRNINTGALTIAAEGGVTINKPVGYLNGIAGQYGTLTYTQRATDVWELVTGTDLLGFDLRYQGIDTDLTTLAGLTATTDNFIVSVASAWASRTPAQVKTTLAYVAADIPTLAPLGSLAAFTGGEIDLTDGTDSHGKMVLAVGGLGTVFEIFGNATDTQYKTLITGNSIQFGPGGSTAPDTKIQRSGAAAATVTGVFTLTSPVFNTGVSGTAIDTDATFAANSDTKLASQKAVKTALDAAGEDVSAAISMELFA